MIDPPAIKVNPIFERVMGKTILLPVKDRIKSKAGMIVKRVTGIDRHASLSEQFKDLNLHNMF